MFEKDSRSLKTRSNRLLKDGIPPERARIVQAEMGIPIPVIRGNSDDLVSLLNSKDKAAFSTIYNQLYPSVFYFAKRFVDSEDAADFTEEAFLKLWKHDKPFPRLESVKSFLQVIVRNACVNDLQHKKVVDRQRREFTYLSNANENDLEYREEVIAEYLKRIRTEIEKLPDQCKKVSKLAFIEGLKNRDIASKLLISEKLVSNQKARAIRLLRLVIPRLH